MKMRKGLALVLACVVALCAGAALAGCGQSDESVIKEDIAAQLDPIKELDEATVAELVDSVDAAIDLSAYGISTQDYVTTMLAGFDYTINQVTVNADDTAVVDATITCKSFTDAQAKANEVATEFANSNDLSSMTMDDINKKVGEILMEAMANTAPKPVDVQFAYTKVNGEWKADGGAASTAINTAFFA